MGLNLLAFRTTILGRLRPAHISLSFITHLACLLHVQSYTATCWLNLYYLQPHNSSKHLVLAAARAHSCQNTSLLLCSRACYCCSLLVFPGKDNVHSDMQSVTSTENKSHCCRCSSDRPTLASRYVIFF